MKKVLLSLSLLLTALSLFSQSKTNVGVSKSDYLLKSKNQKKTGRTLLLGGPGLVITSFIIPRGDLVYDGICVGPYCSDEYKNDNIKTALFLVGVASDLVSIPFFIASKKNKKRAMNVSTSFKMEKAQVIQHATFVNRSFSAFSVKISL